MPDRSRTCVVDSQILQHRRLRRHPPVHLARLPLTTSPPTFDQASLSLLLGDLTALLAPLEALVDLSDDDANSNDEDDAEDNHDTDVLGRPALALGQLVHNRIAGDEGVDGDHFVGSGDGLGD